MTITPGFSPQATERDTQDMAHTSEQNLGHVAVGYAVSPELLAEIQDIKQKALTSLQETGEVPAEHMPDTVPLSPESRADVDAVKANYLANGDQFTT